MKICANKFDVYPRVAFAGTRGSYGIEAVFELEFDECWDGLSKTVSFYPADGGAAVSVVLGSETFLKIPYEVMCKAGQARYIISGTDGENTIISVSGMLQVIDTLDPASVNAGEPTESVFDQMLAKLSDAQSAAESAAESASECEKLINENNINSEATKAYAESAASSASSAQNSLLAAEKASEAAVSAAESSKLSEESAASSAVLAQEAKNAAESAATIVDPRAYSNALVGTVSGEAVKLDDVSPVEHELSLSVRQEDLMPYPYVSTDAEINGVNFSEKDGTVTVDGTATGGLAFALGNVSLEAGVYSIGGFSLSSSYTDGDSVMLRIKNNETGEWILNENISGVDSYSNVFELSEAVSDARITVQFIVSDESYSGSMTPYLVKGERIEDISSVTLTKYGKNLYDFYAEGIMSQQGVTECVVDGYSITAKGNEGSAQYSYDAGQLLFPYTSAAIIKEKGFAAKKGITYTISFDALLHEIGKYSDRIQILVYYSDLSMVHNQYGLQLELGVNKRYSFSFTPAKDDRIEVTFRLNNNRITFSNIQIEAGASANGYEPYVESVAYTPNANGTVEGVTSVYPTTTLISDTEGVVIECEYNKDANKVIARLTEAVAALSKNA